MRDHLFVGLLAAAFLVLNAWLGRGWIDAIGGAVAVAVFGEVAGWYIHRPRRPSRGRRSPRRTKAQRAEQPAGARRRERQDWVAEVGAGMGVIALGLALLSLPPLDPETQRCSVLDCQRRAVHLVGEDRLLLAGLLDGDGFVEVSVAVLALGRGLVLVVHRKKRDVARADRRPAEVEQRRQRHSPPFPDRGPALDAGVLRRLCPGR